ncbi:hypothetical protein [Irregularibacter muris]|nr:hypothetical protein [Irregularibacter muris]
MDFSVLSFDDNKIRGFFYEETERYKVTALLINNKQRLLNNMLDKE